MPDVTSGWGRLTWNQANWGDATTLKTGWGAQAWSGEGGWGDLSDQTITLDGQSSTTNVGSFSFDLTSNVFLSGQEATTSVGDLSVQVDYTDIPTGLESTSSVGSPTLGFTYELSGQEATASPGSITMGVTYLLEMIGANHSMTTSVGSPTIIGEIGVPLTGVQSDFATPTLSYTGTLVGWGRDEWGDLSWGESPNQVISAVGVDATASVGSIAPADVVGLSGQEVTTSVGSTTIQLDSTPDITGQEATVGQGTLGLEFGPAAISGIAATSGVGTLGLEFGPAEITGVSATTGVGSIEIGSVELIDVTGVEATSTVGSLSPDEMSIGLSSQVATFATGSFDIADIVQGLITDEITSTTGILGIQHYANIDSGSNTSYSNTTTGSNTSYSDEATGSNTSYSNKTTGSNGSYSNVATGSNTSYTDAA